MRSKYAEVDPASRSALRCRCVSLTGLLLIVPVLALYCASTLEDEPNAECEDINILFKVGGACNVVLFVILFTTACATNCFTRRAKRAGRIALSVALILFCTLCVILFLTASSALDEDDQADSRENRGGGCFPPDAGWMQEFQKVFWYWNLVLTGSFFACVASYLISIAMSGACPCIDEKMEASLLRTQPAFNPFDPHSNGLSPYPPRIESTTLRDFRSRGGRNGMHHPIGAMFPIPKGPEPWNCINCSFANSGRATKCQMCDGPRIHMPVRASAPDMRRLPPPPPVQQPPSEPHRLSEPSHRKKIPIPRPAAPKWRQRPPPPPPPPGAKPYSPRGGPIRNTAASTASLDESEECKICFEKKINCVLLTCGHMCACYDCGLALQTEGQDCPLCRSPISAVQKVYK